MCQEERSKEQNTRKAFRRMADSEVFQKWLRVEAARRSGDLAEVEKNIERELRKVRVDIHDENGQWVTVGQDAPLED